MEMKLEEKMLKEQKIEGREIASFECRARSESISKTALPGAMGIFAFIASGLSSNPDYIVIFFVIIALLPVIAPIISTLFPRTRSICTIKEGGIRLKPVKPKNARGRFLKWRDLSRFSAKSMGLNGGRIYLYPKGLFSFLRRDVIEPLNMSDYHLLFNYVSSRVGIF